MQPCIFCKVINHEIPSTIVKENDHALAIKDLYPKAPVHYLVLPKKHIESLLYIEPQDGVYTQAMIQLIHDLGKELPAPQAFNVFSNNGEQAGQSVFHMHFHFLAGKNIYESGLKL